MRSTRTTWPSCFVLVMLAACARADDAVAPAPRPYPEHLQWWAEARFGIFVHWGPVSLKGTEISWSRANTNPECPNRGPIPAEEYDNLYKSFNPVRFDADEWIGIARAAGAKYLVLTAKHCDGFLLWHSQTSDYHIGQTPFQRDVCAELVQAARRQQFRIGWYFSPMDWRDPDFRTERNADFLNRMRGQLREVLANYGPIDLLWFDWDGGKPVYDQPQTYAIVNSLQPQIVVNNRLDLGPGNSDRQILSPHANYYTPEQTVGAYDDQQPWESCMTTSRRGQWAWGGNEDGVKPLETCLDMLVRCAGGDGNLLLNVGPTPEGEIAPEQAGLLRDMGKWLADYGTSIYGTRGGPFKPGDYGVSTRKNKTIFVHVRDWSDETVHLPAIPAQVLDSRVLTGGQAVVKQTDAGISIQVPTQDRQTLDTIIALELDRSALDLSALAVPGPPSLSLNAKATASNIYQNLSEYGPDKAVDGRADTRWATDSGVTAAWLELDLGQPRTFQRAVIKQAYPELQRVQKYAIEYWEEGQWRACYHGEQLAATLDARFPPVTAQRVRLNITQSTDGPTVWEFRVCE
ncbi:MAG: alpha-L-fucosidase [Pirellulaceae bacterium]|nr:alpha-L-fucosidase [Pirellulaceae bacterium]